MLIATTPFNSNSGPVLNSGGELCRNFQRVRVPIALVVSFFMVLMMLGLGQPTVVQSQLANLSGPQPLVLHSLLLMNSL